MGSYVTKHGDTPGELARKYLGDARRWKELWPGDPHKMPTGYTIHIPQGPSGQQQVGATAGDESKAPTTDQNKEVANLPGAERAQLQALAAEFMQLVGYRSDVNENALMYLLYKQGLQNNPDQAFAFMFDHMSGEGKQSSPWARYGLDEATYMNTRGKLIAAWTDLTGGNMPDDVLAQALGGHWSEQQLEQFARSDAGLAKGQPWLAEGQSHLQVQEAYIASYGHAPQDDQVLASWFRFMQTAKQVGPSPGRPTQLVQTGTLGSHGKDTEVR